MIVRITEDNLCDASIVYSKAWQASHKEIVAKDLLETYTPQRQMETLRRQMKVNDLFMYYSGNIPVGILVINVFNHEIVSLYVDPDFWGQGYSKKLLEFGISQMPDNSMVSLIVMNVNLRARAFYEKCGFIYDSEIKLLSREKQISELKYIFQKQ